MAKDLFHQINNRSTIVSNDNENYQSVAQFYAGKSVFITGGTGFLGKLVIEKLLYSCPNVNKVFVLIREKNHDHAYQRIQCMVDSPVFLRLKEKRPQDLKKIIPIVGDLTAPNLGIKAVDENALINEVLVHISTAYTNTERKIIDEVVYPPPAELDEVYDFVEKYGNDEKKTAKLLNGKPNTYTFSKALAENYVLKNHGNIPTVIIRPSIISPAVKEPYSGWVETWFGGTAILTSIGKGFCRVLLGHKDNVLDLIPVDYVTNLTLVAGAKCNSSEKLTVLNCCSSSCNPITMNEICTSYASESVKLGFNDLPFPGALISNCRWLVSLIILLTLTLPAYIVDICFIIRRKPTRYVKAASRMRVVSKLLEYFTTHTWVIESSGVTALYNSLSPTDKQLWPCDVTNLDWKKYITTYVKGVQKYLINKSR